MTVFSMVRNFPNYLEGSLYEFDYMIRQQKEEEATTLLLILIHHRIWPLFLSYL